MPELAKGSPIEIRRVANGFLLLPGRLYCNDNIMISFQQQYVFETLGHLWDFLSVHFCEKGVQ